MILGICLPHLRVGGIEKGFVSLLAPLRERGIKTVLFVKSTDGVLVEHVPDDTVVVAIGEVGVARTAVKLASLLARHPVDVLWTATNALNIAALLAARILGSKAPLVVVGEHIPVQDFLATRRFTWLRVALMRWLYPRAAALVAPSSPLIEEHRTLLGTSCPQGTVLQNPVIDGLAPERSQAPVARKIVSLGRLSPEKGFDLALCAFARHLEQDPNAQLTIFGTGPERDALLSLTCALGLEKSVSFPGHTSDVAAALADADLYLCTSHVEGFGNAIVEAQAASVPVISVDCPVGPRILLEGGKAGRLVTERNATVLGEAITSFAKDLEARKEAVSRGRKNALKYTRNASADAHAELVSNLLRRPLNRG